jgi:predicted lipid-binding transport protein (Tim44 family)
MTQKAEHHFQDDYKSTYASSDGQSKWIWGILAALAALAFIFWLASYSGPSPGLGTAGSTSTEQIAPAPVAPAAEPAAPAADPAAPAQAPAAGGTQNP